MNEAMIETADLSRNRLLRLLLGGVAALLLSAQSMAASMAIESPEQARRLGLDSLRLAVERDGGVPLPTDLPKFVKNPEAAIQLGKALFWDMQVGSDGVQACASCHFHAGTDDSIKNAVNPGMENFVNSRQDNIIGYLTANNPTIAPSFETKEPNQTLTREDFPLVKTIEDFVALADGSIGPGVGNSNDVIGPMGTFMTSFNGVLPGSSIDLGSPLPDPNFHVGGVNVRQVGLRNSATVINAVFNFNNFWDGSANFHFNGKNVFGDQDPNAGIFVNQPKKGLVKVHISLDNGSLASQAMNPPRAPNEMSFGDLAGSIRQHWEIGRKLLRVSPQSGVPLVPLGSQHVPRHDSVLGPLVSAPFRGLNTSYEAMIKKAFADQYWNSSDSTLLPSTPSNSAFTQMEANFSLFFGLAVGMYESTLVADRTPFDHWMETGRFNRFFGKKELAGLNLFANQGQCIKCHAGPELTKASVRSAQGEKNLIRAMEMAQGEALYDIGFYNTSVTPTTDDYGRGNINAFGSPVAFSRQALVSRLGLAAYYGLNEIDFPILGNNYIPAVDEDLGHPVCVDANHDGYCEADENILPGFQRDAVDGAFKTPGLRNVELTGPYFHNGGVATLRQVVQFYNRGGNFCNFNLNDMDPSIQPLGLSAAQEEELVAFMVSLTDPRVKYQQAPFDHPELRIPADGFDAIGTRTIKAVGARGAEQPLGTFLNLNPMDAIYTPRGLCTKKPS